MSDEKGRTLLAVAGALKTERSTFERHWQDITDVMRPQMQSFVAGQLTDADNGAKRTAKIVDSLPPLAAEKHAAVMEAMLSPRNQTWATLTVGADDELSEDIEVKRYLDQVNRILFRARYRPGSNLASQLAESYLSLGLFGTQALFVGDDVGRSIMYRSVPLRRLLIDEDSYGGVSKVFRTYSFTAEQAYEEFLRRMPKAEHDKTINRFPQGLRAAYESKSRHRWEFMHAVLPRAVVEDGLYDYRGMPYASCHILVNDGSTIKEGGFRTMPYAVSRYTKSADEMYGRSPAMIALADVLMLNRMSKAVIKGAERATDPPLMLADDALEAFNLRSGALNYGALGPNGEDLVKAFNSGARVEIGKDLIDDKRAAIREAFLIDVFQILTQSPVMTATQVLEVAKEKAALLAPVMGRQQSELFGPMTTRELDILSAAGQLPPMPDALIDRGGEVSIEYQSPLALAQRAETGVAILRTLESVTALAQTEEGAKAMRVFNIAETVRELALVNNFPAKALRTKAELGEMNEQDAAQQQAAQLLQAAPVVTQSIESLANAQAAAGRVNV